MVLSTTTEFYMERAWPVPNSDALAAESARHHARGIGRNPRSKIKNWKLASKHAICAWLARSSARQPKKTEERQTAQSF